MNLEKGINILFEKLVDENAIDVSEDFLLNNFDIYSDIQAIGEKIINSGYNGGTRSLLEETNKIVDVSKLLELESDYVFLELTFINLFSRPIERSVLDMMLKDLAQNKITREIYLKSLEDSQEARDKSIYLTGFKEISVEDFKNLKNKEFVRRAYIRILRRYADPYGLKDFTIKLKIGELTREDVIERILYSPEASGKKVPKFIKDNDKTNSSKNSKHQFYNKNKVDDNLILAFSEDYDEYDRLENAYLNANKYIRDLNMRDIMFEQELFDIRRRLDELENFRREVEDKDLDPIN